jgi:hypothetical protein
VDKASKSRQIEKHPKRRGGGGGGISHFSLFLKQFFHLGTSIMHVIVL